MKRDEVAIACVLPPGWVRLAATGQMLVARPESWPRPFPPVVTIDVIRLGPLDQRTDEWTTWISARRQVVLDELEDSLMIEEVEADTDHWWTVAHDHPAGSATTVQRHHLVTIAGAGPCALVGWATATDPDWSTTGPLLGLILATAGVALRTAP